MSGVTSGLSVILCGPYLSHSGFSKTNREIALRLSRRGVAVRADVCETKVEVDERTREAIRRLSKTPVPPKTPIVYSMTVPPVIGNDGPRILFTMIETSRGLHKDYAERMNLASEVWVPTTHMSDLMYEAGVASPVRVIPLGVDPEVFGPGSGRMALPRDARGYRFLSVSWWGPRKGFDILIRAFVTEFSSKDDVSLVISSRAHDGRPSSRIADEIRGIVRATGKTDRPPVVLHSAATTDRELASLYNACDAFVLASRGEGFSLPIVEAASCGLPVIATRCTAQATYLDDSNSFLLEPEGYEKANPRDGRPSSVGRWCVFYENQFFPVLGGQSVRALGSLMRRAYEDRGEAARRAAVLAGKVRTSMTWENTVDAIEERLSELSATQGGKR